MAEAAWIVDAVFRAAPQFVSEPLSVDLGVRLVVKVETPNPVCCLKQLSLPTGMIPFAWIFFGGGAPQGFDPTFYLPGRLSGIL
jgi:hypothetical protein